MSCSLLNTDEETIEVPDAPDPYAVWLITESEVLDDRSGRDGIPSIDRPQFNPAAFSAYLEQHRRVIGININNDLRAYPHQILDWHEVVNDEVGGRPVAVTLSPHSGSSIAWDRSNSGFAVEFGVAGLMFRNNVILYDRQTESYWPQMRLGAVTGSRINQPVEPYMVVETTLQTWRDMFPNSQVLNTSTGYARSYDGYAYGYNYDTDDLRVIYPITHIDKRLPRKTRLHGILKQQPALDDVTARIYKIDDFGEGISLITDRIGTKEFILAGSASYDLVSAFERPLRDGTLLDFKPVQDNLPIILTDNEGNLWDVFGYAVQGPRKGERLVPAVAYTAYFFAWADHFPGIEIYGYTEPIEE